MGYCWGGCGVYDPVHEGMCSNCEDSDIPYAFGSKLSFSTWLRLQVRRRDGIGDIARDWFADGGRPKTALSIPMFRKRLQNANACDAAKQCAEEAIAEYRRQAESTHQSGSTRADNTETTPMLRGDTRLHRNGEQFAISTNADTERDFLDGVASALAGLDSTANELAQWLPLIVDITAKLRGYKADVIERRLIVAGAWLPDDSASIVSAASLGPQRPESEKAVV